MQVVISSAFESRIGLAQYACLAQAIDAASCLSTSSAATEAKEAEAASTAAVQALPGRFAHGLATLSWFQSNSCPELLHLDTAGAAATQRIASEMLLLQSQPVAIYPDTITEVLDYVCMANSLPLYQNVQSPGQVQRISLQCKVATGCGQYTFNVSKIAAANAVQHTTDLGKPSTFPACVNGHQQHLQKPICIFLHGFLGDAEDWEPIMTALALTHESYALDLPGHGKTSVQPAGVCNTSLQHYYLQGSR